MQGTPCLVSVVVTLATLAAGADDDPPSKDVEIINTNKDRTLFIRSIPGVLGYSSNIYEIPMHPYAYDIAPNMALAVVEGGDGEADGGGCMGEITFTQPSPGAPVLITGNVTGLSAGMHGMHIHTKGDLRHGCESTGPHFNPYRHHHGAPPDPMRHVGDLGNIRAGEDGMAKFEFMDPIITLSGGPRGIVGRSVVIHAGQDDLGRGPDMESARYGNSGPPLCCGVIGYIN